MTKLNNRSRSAAPLLEYAAHCPAARADAALCKGLAEQGHAQAQFNLGKCYPHGHGVDPDDRAARDWFAKASLQGYPPALREFGNLFQLGRGMPRDLMQAAQLHLSAASAGDEVARRKLAGYRDELMAMALRGHREAAFDLHRCHAEGLGVDKSPSLGWAWIRWAWEKCPPLPTGQERYESLDEEVASVHGFFRAVYDPPTRRSGNQEFKAFVQAAKELASSGATRPGGRGQNTRGQQ